MPKVTGLMLVRNEADILRANILHHLSAGVSELLIVDNGSTDGTDRLLAEMAARDHRICWTRDDGPYFQPEITTELAREAFLRGADWVLPIDADEFWFTPDGDLADALAMYADYGAIEASVVNFVQRREELSTTTSSLLTMTRRPFVPAGSIETITELVENERISYIEMLYPPKWISRAAATLQIEKGNHAVRGQRGRVTTSDRIRCLHAPLRSFEILRNKARDFGDRVAELRADRQLDWHVQRWQRLEREGALEREWRANSFDSDGALDVFGRRQQLLFDPTLANLVAAASAVRLPAARVAVPASLALRRIHHYERETVPLPASGFASSSEDNGPIVDAMERVEGYLFRSEAELLVAVTRNAMESFPESPNVVEIGSYLGRSTVGIALAARDVVPAARVYAIDPHDGELGAADLDFRTDEPTLQRFRRHLEEAGVSDVVTTIVQRSTEVDWSSPIALLFIDGLHDYASVRADFRHFEPFVERGGFIAFHDYGESYPGVTAAVEEILRGRDYVRARQVDSLVVLQKVSQSVPIHHLIRHENEGTRNVDSPFRNEVSTTAQRSGAARYELPIDEKSDSTHARVVRLVGRDKRVLELGCSTGYMSRVLTNNGCEVTGVEVDCDAAARAMESCARVIVGDVEALDFVTSFGDERFDVIVAADVLEHLRDPAAVLARVRTLLRPDGYVVASIPNIAHGSVRLALLNGRFSYTETGLLDQTHLRFFTRQTMEKLFEDCGFAIGTLERQDVPIDQTELEASRAGVPDAVLRTIDADPDARTYQFIVRAFPLPSAELRLVAERMRDAAVELEGSRRRIAALEGLERRTERQDEALRQLSEEVAQRDRVIHDFEQRLHAKHEELMAKAGERDQIIRALQTELHEKVGQRDHLIESLQRDVEERDRTILSQQAELNDKVGERDRIIGTLQAGLTERDGIVLSQQAELHEKVAERDRIIGTLQNDLAERDGIVLSQQAELHEKVAERDRIIGTLQNDLAERDGIVLSQQAELREKVAERDRIIGTLQNELAERDRAILARQSESNAKVDERDRMIHELQNDLAQRDRIVLSLQAELSEKVSERDRTIGALQAAAVERDRCVLDQQSAFSEALLERNRLIESLHHDYAERERRTVEEKAGRVAELERATEALRTEFEKRERLAREEAEEAIDALRNQLADRERIVLAQQSELAATADELEALRRQSEAQAEEVAKQLTEVATERNEITHAEQTLAAELERIRAAVAEHERRTAGRLRGELRSFHRSRAWRIASRYWAFRAWLTRRRNASDPLEEATASVSQLNRQLDRIHRSFLWRTASVYWALVAWFRRPAEPQQIEDDLSLETIAARPPVEVNAPVVRQNAHDVICFPIIDWSFRHQRPQHLMTHFGNAGHRVFYISHAFRDSGPPVELKPVAANVYEVTLRAPRRRLYSERMSQRDQAILFSAIDALRRESQLGATSIIVQLPYWKPLAEQLRKEFAWPVTYDCMDFHDGFSTATSVVAEEERELLKSADLVVVSSKVLESEARKHNRNVHLVPNACEYEHFCRIDPVRPRGSGRPVIGYYGAIADWFDSDLVAAVARSRPDWDFLLVGATDYADVSDFQKLANVHLAGEQPYSEIPEWLAKFDVCIIPFKRTPLTEATNPVKVYEMLAGGKPVVSVRIPEVAALGSFVRLASDAREFEREIEQALSENTKEFVESRRAFARENTWQKRYEAFHDAVRDSFPLASIIIVTYQNAELNRLCLESLYAEQEWPNFEVIVVDNASQDATPELLRGLEKELPHLQVIYNATNAGFAAANNQGLSRARGRYLALLNNDTVSTRGWLSRLIAHVESDHSIGLIGPSTNAIGNEAMVSVGYNSVEERRGWIEAFTKLEYGHLFDITMLAMFCVVLRRDVYEEIGSLDENFGVGMFEDDDYAQRLRQAGYRLVCARDTFMHHWMKAAFGKIPKKTYDALFERNRAYFEQKWKREWQRHKAAI